MGAANKLLAEIGGTADRAARGGGGAGEPGAPGAGGDRASGGGCAVGACRPRCHVRRRSRTSPRGSAPRSRPACGRCRATADGALILLGDMPRIAAAASRSTDRGVCRRGWRGHHRPAARGQARQSRAVAARLFRGDAATRGRRRRQAAARRARRPACASIDLGTDAIFADVDTPEALAELRGVSPRGEGAARAARYAGASSAPTLALPMTNGETGMSASYFLFSRAIRLEVSQRPPPIFCTSA